MLLLILLLIGVCLSDDDRLVDKEDMRFGFEVWQVCVYMYITDTLSQVNHIKKLKLYLKCCGCYNS